jgi:hypothetical protein
MVQYKQDTKNIWFPNQIEPVYDPSDSNQMFLFHTYWKAERDRCINGFYLDKNKKVYVSGWLYFHTVYWKISMYETLYEGTPQERTVREIKTPILRDIDWVIANDLVECEKQGKFYSLIGSRGFGKSIIAASRAGWLYTFFHNSQSVISAGATNYIKLVTDKIEDGLTNLHPIFVKNRLTSNWKMEVMAGWKDKTTNAPHPKSSKSQILMRNFEDGNNSMVCNGTRPGFHLIDEIGTLKNLIGCYKDSDGCWWAGSTGKPSCLVFITGTGGDMEVGAEAAEMFYDPKSYNLLEFDNHWEGGGKIGRFVEAGTGVRKYLKEKTLNEYLNIDKKVVDVSHIPIMVSDIAEYDKDWWEPKFQNAKKSGNSKTLLKFKAYWCKKPSDSFIILTKNDFNTEEAKRQQKNIRDNNLQGVAVDLLYADNGVVIHDFSEKLPITEFPVKTQSKDAPIMIYEFPMPNPPFGLYVAGVDPYRHSESEYSDSLGTVYIYKRMHEIGSEKYQDMFVASYTARPGDIKEWNENARRLIKFYNARTLCENDEMSFINYMIDKGDGHYLEDQPEWLRLIVPNTKVNRKKGIHRSAKQIRDFLDGQLKEYLDQVVHEEKNENGSVINQVFGTARILDPMLLEEIIRFDKEKNFDRVIAAELAVALANKLNPILKVNSLEADGRIQAYFNRLIGSGGKKQQRPKSVFNMNITGRRVSGKKSRLFL